MRCRLPNVPRVSLCKVPYLQLPYRLQSEKSTAIGAVASLAALQAQITKRTPEHQTRPLEVAPDTHSLNVN